jgi:pimeloyl-ACP methyl ester carboxylesterase
MTRWTDLEVEVGDGVVLHAIRSGQGSPIVLAHGMLDDGGCWTRVADALASDHDVVAYDARYHGKTREPDGAAWGGADDLVALVDALALDQPVAMGHSMGAGTVAAAVAGHPDRFRAAVLEDPAWRDEAMDASALRDGRAAFDAMLAGSEAEIEAGGRQFSPGWDDAEYGPWAAAKKRFRGTDQLEHALERVLGTPWQELVAGFRVPVLLLCGGDQAKGRIVSAETAAEAAAICPTLEVATFPDAGHNVRREAFDGYLTAVTAFLDRVEG